MRGRKRIVEYDRLLGFVGFFALYAIPGLLDGEWIWASWLAWVVWFLFFLPRRDEEQGTSPGEGMSQA